MKTNNASNNIHKRAARISGISLVLMTIAAFFSLGYVHETLFVIDNPTATFSNLQNGQSLFQAGIAGWLVIIITDLLVTWGFYTYLKTVNTPLAIIFSILRLIYTLILSYAVYQLIAILFILEPSVGNIDVLGLQTIELINAFETVWSFGLILFGVHLGLVGLTSLKSSQIPRWIGIFLIIGGLSYTVIHILYNFTPDYESLVSTIEVVLQLPMIIGELGFGLWLLIKGYKINP